MINNITFTSNAVGQDDYASGEECEEDEVEQPRLQGALSLKQKGPLKGVHGNRGS